LEGGNHGQNWGKKNNKPTKKNTRQQPRAIEKKKRQEAWIVSKKGTPSRLMRHKKRKRSEKKTQGKESAGSAQSKPGNQGEVMVFICSKKL